MTSRWSSWIGRFSFGNVSDEQVQRYEKSLLIFLTILLGSLSAMIEAVRYGRVVFATICFQPANFPILTHHDQRPLWPTANAVIICCFTECVAATVLCSSVASPSAPPPRFSASKALSLVSCIAALRPAQRSSGGQAAYIVSLPSREIYQNLKSSSREFEYSSPKPSVDPLE